MFVSMGGGGDICMQSIQGVILTHCHVYGGGGGLFCLFLLGF